MALNLENKKAIVAEVHDVSTRSISVVAADYHGLTVSELNELRTKARAAEVHLQVVRNTLAKRAFEGTSYACLHDALVGPLVLAFSLEAPSAAARLLRDFAKDHPALEVKALALEGRLYPAEQLAAIASLPSKDEALSMLLSVMKAPITKLARTLAEPYAQVVRAVAAYGEQKAA